MLVFFSSELAPVILVQCFYHSIYQKIYIYCIYQNNSRHSFTLYLNAAKCLLFPHESVWALPGRGRDRLGLEVSEEQEVCSPVPVPSALSWPFITGGLSRGNERH